MQVVTTGPPEPLPARPQCNNHVSHMLTATADMQHQPAGCNINRLAATPIGWLQHQPAGCNINRLASTSSGWLHDQPAGFNINRLAATPTGWLQHQPAGCNINRLAATSTCRGERTFTNSTQQRPSSQTDSFPASTKIAAYYAIRRFITLFVGSRHLSLP